LSEDIAVQVISCRG